MQMPSADELAARAAALEPVAIAQEAAKRAGIGGVYLIGGAVRDLIRGAEPVDVDLATEADPQLLVRALTSATGAEPERSFGPQTRFGTVAFNHGGVRYDVARTRTEHYPRPGALPDVAPATIEQDLLRRDFTVNAIALGLSGSRTGELIAAPGAADDLRDRRLAVLHDRSFHDDPTRLTRLARYHARLGFEVDPHTRALATDAIAAGALGTVSGTRIGNELRLLATEPDPVGAFLAVSELGLPWSIDADLARRAFAALPTDGRPDLLVLATVFATVFAKSPGTDLSYELDRLGFLAADRDAIVEAATQSVALAKSLSQTGSRSEIARAVGTAGIETIVLASAQGAASQSQTWLHDLRHLTLQITGADLIDNGVPTGPRVGDGLQAARSALMDGLAPDRESQLAIALKAAQ